MEDVGRVRRRSSAGSTPASQPSQLAACTRVSSALRVLPGEVRVGLREADLGERRHHRRPRERLGEEHRRRVRGAHLARSATPRTASGFVCGLSTRKTVTPRSTQKRTTSRSACQSAAPVLAVEVDVVDVLVALRRVLGVLERAVGAAVEPLRVLASATGGRASTGSRSRARSRCPSSCAARDEPLEVGERAELGVDRVVAALRRSRSPTGCRGRPGRRRARCCGPCGSCARSGGSAAGRRRRSRARRAAAAARATPSKPPHERGKSSYHAPKRARSRSTSTLERRCRRRGLGAVARRRGERLLDASASATPSRTAPSASSLARSAWPAVDLPRAARSARRRRGRPRPRSRTPSGRAGRPRRAAVQRSLPSGLERRLEPARRARPAGTRTAAPSTSWPSRKIVAPDARRARRRLA